MYTDNLIVSKNLLEAKKWLKKSASKDFEEAKKVLEEFVKQGCRVTFSGTTDSSVTSSYDRFPDYLNPDLYKGVVCDVRNNREIETLWDFATQLFGDVDIWINNAGIANREAMIGDLDPDELERVIDINIKGLINCCRISYNRMLKQGKGAIYNMGGLGSDGRIIKGLAPYGSSKRAVQYFTKAFAKEIHDSPVNASLILPGMVVTDMILDPIRQDPEGSRRARRIFNILSEEVETVSAYLVEEILSNEKNGAVISYLTPFKAFSRFITRPLSGRDIISDKL
jgi:NAD(P)-dependent dehydrogenase (short-subunit alcohol dehydrogenase family)